MTTSLLKLFIALASRLPLPVARRLGSWVGALAWHRNTRAAKITRLNIALCFPDLSADEQARLARASLGNWGMTIFEVPVVWRRGVEALSLIGTVHGEELMKQQLASGRGTIMLSPHLGNWELAGLWASTYGPTTILYQPPKQAALEEITRRGRGKAGATLVATNLRGVSALIKALKKGQITGILPDMVPDPSGGVVVPFMGVPALTMTLTHSLQQRSGAGILLAFARRTAKGFDIHVLEPTAAIYSEDPEESTTALNALIARSVMLAPEQYQWEYKRFRNKLSGQPSVYDPQH